MKKVLLLNLPYGDKKLQRDLSCPHTSKADYYWPCMDLVAYSGILSNQDLYLIDAVQERNSEFSLLRNIKKINPDFIFTIISSISFNKDLVILGKIKKMLAGVKICASGDLCSFEPEKLKGLKEIDFIISDFTESEKIREIVHGGKKNKIVYSTPEKKEFKIGIPRHELFMKYKYNMPYSYYDFVVSSLTNYGCPFRCRFCNSNNLAFKTRELNEIVEEIKYFQKIGVKEIYFRDLTFGVPRIEKILKKMIENNFKIRWSCEFRADLANEKILSLMKKAGCFLIFYGGESGNQKTLDMMKKGFNIEQLKKAIALTKKQGIETLVSFIVGFEHESIKDVQNTEKIIFETDPDFISINILVSRIGSDIRAETDLPSGGLDNSSEQGKKYSNGKYALDYKKKIEKKFFFRPKKLFRYFFLSIKTKNRFKNFIKSGIDIFKRIFIDI